MTAIGWAVEAVAQPAEWTSCATPRAPYNFPRPPGPGRGQATGGAAVAEAVGSVRRAPGRVHAFRAHFKRLASAAWPQEAPDTLRPSAAHNTARPRSVNVFRSPAAEMQVRS